MTVIAVISAFVIVALLVVAIRRGSGGPTGDGGSTWFPWTGDGGGSDWGGGGFDGGGGGGDGGGGG